MKYCSQCGEPNVDEANFCHNCGRDLSKDVVKGQGKQSEKIEPHGDTPAPTPSDKKQGMDSWTLYRALDVAMLLLVTFAPWIRFNLLVHSQDLSLLGSMQAIKRLSQNTGVSSGELGFLAILMLVLWLVSVCSLIRDLMDDAKEKPNSAIGAITVIMACVVVLIATYWQNNSWNNPDTSNVAARLISSATQNPFSVTGWFWITALVGVATCVVKRSNRLQGDAQSSSFVEAMEQFGKKFIPDPTKTDT
ncbi:MAG: zinc ribbon domain-containing protein, partial [Atopobiaceae bacterium]|nr:zinc ribbon domain-containing protein [Atopobiaceae bacterium]